MPPCAESAIEGADRPACILYTAKELMNTVD